MLLVLASSHTSEVCIDLQLLLALTFFAVIGLAAACHYFVVCLQSGFDAACNWLEGRLAARKLRRDNSPVQAEQFASPLIPPATEDRRPSLSSVPVIVKKHSGVTTAHPRAVNAHEALRRSCTSSD